MKKTERITKLLAILLTLCLVAASFHISDVQAAAKKSSGKYWISTGLNGTKGGYKKGYNGSYWSPGTKKVVIKGNKITFYGSFLKGKKVPIKNTKANFKKYAKRTYTITSKTKYYEWSPERWKISKKEAFHALKSKWGLTCWMQIKDGKILSINFSS